VSELTVNGYSTRKVVCGRKEDTSMQTRTFAVPYKRSFCNEEHVLSFDLKELKEECKKEHKKSKKKNKVKKKEKKKFLRSIADKIIDAAISLVKEAAMVFFKHKLAII